MTRARDINPVRLRRESLGMLLIELARKVERSPALISQCEGGYVPKLPTMRKIAAALDTTADRLWPAEFEPIPEGER